MTGKDWLVPIVMLVILAVVVAYGTCTEVFYEEFQREGIVIDLVYTPEISETGFISGPEDEKWTVVIWGTSCTWSTKVASELYYQLQVGDPIMYVERVSFNGRVLLRYLPRSH